jgi:hypothetical protein
LWLRHNPKRRWMCHPGWVSLLQLVVQQLARLVKGVRSRDYTVGLRPCVLQPHVCLYHKDDQAVWLQNLVCIPHSSYMLDVYVYWIKSEDIKILVYVKKVTVLQELCETKEV